MTVEVEKFLESRCILKNNYRAKNIRKYLEDIGINEIYFGLGLDRE